MNAPYYTTDNNNNNNNNATGETAFRCNLIIHINFITSFNICNPYCRMNKLRHGRHVKSGRIAI
jgi:hypothetical protein